METETGTGMGVSVRSGVEGEVIIVPRVRGPGKGMWKFGARW